MTARRAMPMARRRTGRERLIGRGLTYLAAVLLALFILAPIYLISVSALTPREDAFTYPHSVVPGELSTETVAFFLGASGVIDAFWRSVLVALITLALSLVIGAPAGYAVARYAFRGRQGYRLLVLSTRAFPIVILAIPLAVTFRAILEPGLRKSVSHLRSFAAIPESERADKAIEIDFDMIPRATYCHPQIASFGYSEAQAKEKGYDVKTSTFPFSANGKAMGLGDAVGFVKIVADATHNEILGAHMIGPDVTELLPERDVNELTALVATRLLALARAPNLVEHLRPEGRVRRWGGSVRQRGEPPPLQPEAERFQDRGELLARAADHRHEFRHHPEAPIAGRSWRCHAATLGPEGNAGADQVRQPAERDRVASVRGTARGGDVHPRGEAVLPTDVGAVRLQQSTGARAARRRQPARTAYRVARATARSRPNRARWRGTSSRGSSCPPPSRG